MMAITLGFIFLPVVPSRCSSLRSISYKWNRKRSHKSFDAEFFNIITNDVIVEPDLLRNIEDRVLPFEAHHDLFDGTVERPIVAPIDPQPVTAEKDWTTKGAFWDVIAGIHSNDPLCRLR